jgi:hypothetical protein
LARAVVGPTATMLSARLRQLAPAAVVSAPDAVVSAPDARRTGVLAPTSPFSPFTSASVLRRLSAHEVFMSAPSALSEDSSADSDAVHAFPAAAALSRSNVARAYGATAFGPFATRRCNLSGAALFVGSSQRLAIQAHSWWRGRCKERTGFGRRRNRRRAPAGQGCCGVLDGHHQHHARHLERARRRRARRTLGARTSAALRTGTPAEAVALLTRPFHECGFV